MRHGISGRKLNRTSSHRKALFMNLSNSLIINEQIKTTLFKAKELRPFVEKIITIGKKNTIHSRRKIFAILRDQNSVKKVLNILSKRYMNRPGGYTRIIKAGFRYGDASPMAVIEFLERDKSAKGQIDKERLDKEKSRESTKIPAEVKETKPTEQKEKVKTDKSEKKE